MMNREVPLPPGERDFDMVWCPGAANFPPRLDRKKDKPNPSIPGLDIRIGHAEGSRDQIKNLPN